LRVSGVAISLFGSLGKILKTALPIGASLLPGPLGKLAGGVSSALLSGHSNKNAVGAANDALQLGLTNGQNALNSQLADSMQALSPWSMGGQQAFGQLGDLAGLHGGGAQGSIIDSLKASPLYQSLFRNGQDTLLNNASATGGLRGGNFQSSLANFGSDTLAQVIQQQLQGYSGLATQGLGATEFGAGLGQNNANALAGLDNQSGQQNALAITNKNTVSNNMFDQLQKLVTSAVSGGAGGGFNLASLFGGSSGGSAAPYAGVGPIGSYGPPSTPMTLPFGGKYDFGPGLPF
jgi:hypothetical protein